MYGSDFIYDFNVTAHTRSCLGFQNPEVSSYPDNPWTCEDFTYDGKTVTGFSNLGRKKFIYTKNLVIPDISNLGEPIVSIGDRAFLGDFSVKKDSRVGISSVHIPDTVRVIGKESFRYNALKEIQIPKNVTMIGQSAFSGNLIRKLELPGNLIDLGKGAFADNEISHIEFPSGMKVIPAAFSFNKLSKLKIPDGVLAIEDYAFSDNLISKLHLPDSLKYLSGFNNNRLKSVSIPPSVVELGEKALARNKFCSVRIPSNIKRVGKSAFWNTWHDTFLTSVSFEDGVEQICDYAFSGNRLDSISLPRSLSSLSDKAFLRSSRDGGPLAVYVEGFKSNPGVKSSKHHTVNPPVEPFRYREESPAKESLVIEEPIHGYPEVSSALYGEHFWSSSDFVYSGNSVAGFSSSGFEKLDFCKDLSIPDTSPDGVPVQSVCKSSFRKLGLKRLRLPRGLVSVGESAFSENELESVFLPESLIEIETYAFYRNRLDHINFPVSIKKIGNNSFAFNGLYSVHFSEDVKNLSLDSFSFCGNRLDKVVLPSEVVKIHSESFRDNRNTNSGGKVIIFTRDKECHSRNCWFSGSKNHLVIPLD